MTLSCLQSSGDFLRGIQSDEYNNLKSFWTPVYVLNWFELTARTSSLLRKCYVTVQRSGILWMLQYTTLQCAESALLIVESGLLHENTCQVRKILCIHPSFYLLEPQTSFQYQISIYKRNFIKIGSQKSLLPHIWIRSQGPSAYVIL